MDGLALAQALRADPALRTLRLVLLSSVLDHAGLGGVNHGLDAQLTKPVREQRLFDCLCAVFAPTAALPRRGRRALDEERLCATRFARRPRILLVEDNEVNQRVGARMLEKLGCAVDLAANGLQALAALRATEYRVVFMDCQMPDMDGFEAVRRWRQEEQGTERHVPIVALTANAMPGDEERCLAAGMDAYLSKPMRLQDLEHALERWLEAHETG